MKVTINNSGEAVDSDGKPYEVVGIEFNPRVFWAKNADHGWEEVFKRELVEGRTFEVIKMWWSKVTVRA